MKDWWIISVNMWRMIVQIDESMNGEMNEDAMEGILDEMVIWFISW